MRISNENFIPDRSRPGLTTTGTDGDRAVHYVDGYDARGQVLPHIAREGAVPVLKPEPAGTRQRRARGKCSFCFHPNSELLPLITNKNQGGMTRSLSKLSALVLVSLLHSVAVHGASVTRHHRLRGGTGTQDAYLSPNSDMIKALEYIESLKRRTDDSEGPTGDYDEVDKFRLLVQLASLRDEDAPLREDAASWPDNKAPEWVRALLRVLEQSSDGALATTNERRFHKSRRPATEAESPVPESGAVVRPHKKYPLMFEDEENVRGNKRATEDLDEQYTPQSLANMRSIFEELGKLNLKRDETEEENEEEDDEGVYRPRNLAYEDVTGGEDWVPLEEQVETEEMVKGSHEEFDRGLEDSEEAREAIERRAAPKLESSDNADDDTKLVDYFLLKVMELSDQAQKRDLTDAQSGRRRLLNMPSLLDPRAIKQLLSAVSMKLQIPPEDLVGMLFMEETRKQQRLPEQQVARKPSVPRYRSRVIKYYNGRQPEVTVGDIPSDVKTEDILKVLGLGNLANKNAKYFVKPRPYKTPISRYFTPNGRRGSFSVSELNRAPSKRKDDYDDAVDEDEVATFLAAKLLTEYPDSSSSDRKRALDSSNASFPYDIYEEAMKDFFDQVDTGKGAPSKRDTQGKDEAEVQQKTPTEIAIQEQSEQQIPESVTEGEKEHHTKLVSGM
ncbi:secretogranin-2 precursor [Silurus asotus]|uniref:Secretogranin-2 n=1 Tax=Silurus asotus TaxID=30991 RepID=A0AAD5AGU2_SILAS|nr:secretogranin-2 precursor [Silurus asotus]